MHELISWFQINYPHYRDELKDSMHNFDDNNLNPYHLESDCWSHTMMVCKIAQIENFDRTVQIAALLHDIGKPSVRRINLKNNHVQFFGHEIVSAYLSVEILQKMIDQNMITKNEFAKIFLLISLHSIFYKEKNIVTLFDKFKKYKNLFVHLIELNKCDNEGRFCKYANYNEENILKNISIEMDESKIPDEIFEYIKKKPTLNEIDFVIKNLFGG